MNKEQYLQKKEELYQLLKSDNLEKLEKYLIELEDPILNKEMLPIYSVLETSLYNSLSANTLKPTMLELIIKYQPNFQYEETVGNSLIHSYGKMGDIKNLEKVLEKLKDVPKEKRTAAFVCTIAFAEPGEETIVVEGKCQGIIAKEPKGTEGFGYDPIFIPDGYDETLAQLGAHIKNKISHRRRALDKIVEKLKEKV